MAQSPLIVDITPLKRNPGKQFPLILSTPPPDGVALVSAEVVATELHLDLLLESIGEQVVAAGTIGVDWVGPCRRCLESQVGRADISMQEIFEKVAVEGETYVLAENDVDLEPMVREVVMLNLPVTPLCSETCAGPDPARFPTTVTSDDGDGGDRDGEDPESDAAARPMGDPRWAALQELSFDDESI